MPLVNLPLGQLVSWVARVRVRMHATPEGPKLERLQAEIKRPMQAIMAANFDHLFSQRVYLDLYRVSLELFEAEEEQRALDEAGEYSDDFVRVSAAALQLRKQLERYEKEVDRLEASSPQPGSQAGPHRRSQPSRQAARDDSAQLELPLVDAGRYLHAQAP